MAGRAVFISEHLLKVGSVASGAGFSPEGLVAGTVILIPCRGMRIDLVAGITGCLRKSALQILPVALCLTGGLSLIEDESSVLVGRIPVGRVRIIRMAFCAGDL